MSNTRSTGGPVLHNLDEPLIGRLAQAGRHRSSARCVCRRGIHPQPHPKGNKRQKYKYFQEVKPGDLVVGYVTSPQREVVGHLQNHEGSSHLRRCRTDRVRENRTP